LSSIEANALLAKRKFPAFGIYRHLIRSLSIEPFVRIWLKLDLAFALLNNLF
jgi:hypothetical protein